MGEMAGEVGAELVQRGRLQPRFEQALRFARPFEQGAVDQPLDRAATAGVAGADWTSGGAPTAR